MTLSEKELDPKRLIFESFQMDAITEAECKSIFLDWALSMPSEVGTTDALKQLIAIYGDQENHPMLEILNAGLHRVSAPPKRRGGWRARPRN